MSLHHSEVKINEFTLCGGNIQKQWMHVGCNDPLPPHTSVEVVDQVTQVVCLWPADRYEIANVRSTDRNMKQPTRKVTYVIFNSSPGRVQSIASFMTL